VTDWLAVCLPACPSYYATSEIEARDRSYATHIVGIPGFDRAGRVLQSRVRISRPIDCDGKQLKVADRRDCPFLRFLVAVIYFWASSGK